MVFECCYFVLSISNSSLLDCVLLYSKLYFKSYSFLYINTAKSLYFNTGKSFLYNVNRKNYLFRKDKCYVFFFLVCCNTLLKFSANDCHLYFLKEFLLLKAEIFSYMVEFGNFFSLSLKKKYFLLNYRTGLFLSRTGKSFSEFLKTIY